VAPELSDEWYVGPVTEADVDVVCQLATSARAAVSARPDRWPAGDAIFASVDGIELGALHARAAMDKLAEVDSDDYTEVRSIVDVVGYLGFMLAVFDIRSGRYQAAIDELSAAELQRLIAARPPASMLDATLLKVDSSRTAKKTLIASKTPSAFDTWYDLECGFATGYSLCGYENILDSLGDDCDE
jgi:hypothetical protein